MGKSKVGMWRYIAEAEVSGSFREKEQAERRSARQSGGSGLLIKSTNFHINHPSLPFRENKNQWLRWSDLMKLELTDRTLTSCGFLKWCICLFCMFYTKNPSLLETVFRQNNLSPLEFLNSFCLSITQQIIDYNNYIIIDTVVTKRIVWFIPYCDAVKQFVIISL